MYNLPTFCEFIQFTCSHLEILSKMIFSMQLNGKKNSNGLVIAETTCMVLWPWLPYILITFYFCVLKSHKGLSDSSFIVQVFTYTALLPVLSFPILFISDTPCTNFFFGKSKSCAVSSIYMRNFQHTFLFHVFQVFFSRILVDNILNF